VGFTFINRKIINSDKYNFLENKDVFQNQEFIETVEMTILTNEHRISNFLLPKKNNFIYKLLYSIKKIILSNRYLYAFSLKIISFISLNPKLSGYLYRFIYSIR
jgi:hypothetical protein